MKKLLLSLFLFSCLAATAQTSGGPDAFGYTWRDSNDSIGPAYNWIDITTFLDAVQVTGLADDNTSQSYQMGFQFPYYWYSVSDFLVGSNGYIIFNNGAISSPFPSIPSQFLPNDFIGAFMSDLTFADVGNTGECWYWTNNADTLIVSYINVPFWINSTPTYTGSNTFQMILTSSDSSITFQYQDQTGTSPALTDYLSIGIENSSGVIGLQHSFNTYPVSGYAIKFYYPASTTFIVSDAATIYNNNPDNGALFLSKDGNPFTMNTRVSNSGNQTLDTVPVFMRTVNSSNVIQAQQNDTAFNLAPQQNADFTSLSLFSPTVAGTYSFKTSTSLSGDFTSANDQKAVELVVVDTTDILIPLSYTGNFAVPVGDGISWSGGNAGVGVEIIPPFYPCYIHKMEFFISSNPANAAFAGLIFDDDGPNGTPGTLLDSAYMPAVSVIAGGWNSFTLQNPLLVDSGSVFVEWLMSGDGIMIGTDTTSPVCNRSYEILGGWSILRYRETRDPMIRLQISSLQVTGLEPISANDFAGNFYPSPSNNKISIEMKGTIASKNIRFDFYDVSGKLVDSKIKGSGSSLYSFDVSAYPAGVYTCKIIAGEMQLNRKIVVVE